MPRQPRYQVPPYLPTELIGRTTIGFLGRRSSTGGSSPLATSSANSGDSVYLATGVGVTSTIFSTSTSLVTTTVSTATTVFSTSTVWMTGVGSAPQAARIMDSVSIMPIAAFHVILFELDI